MNNIPPRPPYHISPRNKKINKAHISIFDLCICSIQILHEHVDFVWFPYTQIEMHAEPEE